MQTLPLPSAEAQAHSENLCALIRTEITNAGGWISFAQYMKLALYAPGLGYYSGGLDKFGSGGDFVTAPEISPLFGCSLANQLAQVLVVTGGSVLELGAGSGKLAGDVLLALSAQDSIPERYYILDISPDLRERQKIYLQSVLDETLMKRVEWLDTLPQEFTGVILGNEVLDALPVDCIAMREDGLHEVGVGLTENQLVLKEQPITEGELFEAAKVLNLPSDYVTEIALQARGLIASLARMLRYGVLLLVDYGFSQREYYHPQRNQGTLMCHYRHYAHDNLLLDPGLQDITAHVDFTAMAEVAVENGLSLLGYTSQASFLLNCGITDLLAQTPASDTAAYLPLAAQAQKLLSPAEMGELFKVIAFGRGELPSLTGFSRGDKRYTL